MDQIWQKRLFPIENRKSELHYWILHIWISAGTKYQLRLTILIFWTKFTQTWYFWLKTEKSGHNDFSLSWRFWFLDQICPKKLFQLKLEKSTLNSAYSNCSWKQISAYTENFNFLEQICPKRVFFHGNSFALVHSSVRKFTMNS